MVKIVHDELTQLMGGETAEINIDARPAVILILLFIFMARLVMVRKALKYAENEIRKTTENVRKTNEIKNRFLSNMSYNIRTCLLYTSFLYKILSFASKTTTSPFFTFPFFLLLLPNQILLNSNQ